MRSIKLNIKAFLFFLLVVLIINFLFFTQINRYRHLTKNLILNGGFELNYKHWNLDGTGKSYLQADFDGTHLKLDGGKEEKYVAVSQKIILKDSYPLFLFEGEVEVKFNTTKHLAGYPALYLAYADVSNKIESDDIQLIDVFKKDFSFKKINNKFEIPENVTSFFFVAVVENLAASLKLNNLKLFPVMQTSSSKISQDILLILDLILFFLALIIILKQKKGWVIALLATLIITGMVIPNIFLQSFIKLIPWLKTSVSQVSNIDNLWGLSCQPHMINELFLWQLKSWTHFISFFILSFITFRLYLDKNLKLIFLSLIVFGGFSEIIQSFTLSRISGLHSLALNLGGIVAAFIIVNIISS